jgi:hypothetical protein
MACFGVLWRLIADLGLSVVECSGRVGVLWLDIACYIVLLRGIAWYCVPLRVIVCYCVLWRVYFKSGGFCRYRLMVACAVLPFTSCPFPTMSMVGFKNKWYTIFRHLVHIDISILLTMESSFASFFFFFFIFWHFSSLVRSIIVHNPILIP